MAIQFGIAEMRYGGEIIGHLQGGSVEISFETSKLYSGNAKFPVSVRTHTGTITGNAEFAQLKASAFQKLLGGTRVIDVVTLANTDSPTTFQLIFQVVTDGITYKITLNKVRSTKLSLAFAREDHHIPNFDFEAEADANGDVMSIDVGDDS